MAFSSLALCRAWPTPFTPAAAQNAAASASLAPVGTARLAMSAVSPAGSPAPLSALPAAAALFGAAVRPSASGPSGDSDTAQGGPAGAAGSGGAVQVAADLTRARAAAS